MSNGVHAFDEAARHLSGGQLLRFYRLRQKIPAEMQGVFGAIVEGGKLQGIELLPNAATQVLNQLAADGGSQPRAQAEHTPNETQRWTGEPFEAILDDSTTRLVDSRLTANFIAYPRTKTAEATERYAGQGSRYRFSSSLGQLLWHGGASREAQLPRAEKQLLDRLGARIPARLHGAFAVDVVEGPEGLAVGGMGVDPNMLCNRIALELMGPILAPESSFMREPSQRAGIRAHHHVFMLDRETLEAAAKKPLPGRQRA